MGFPRFDGVVNGISRKNQITDSDIGTSWMSSMSSGDCFSYVTWYDVEDALTHGSSPTFSTDLMDHWREQRLQGNHVP